eukprot:234437_1
MMFFTLLFIFTSSILMNINHARRNLKFEDILGRLDSCPKYDTIQTFCTLEAINEEKKRENLFENKVNMQEYELILGQISPAKYLSKTQLIACNIQPELLQISKYIEIFSERSEGN